jgi:hypothetical protein
MARGVIKRGVNGIMAWRNGQLMYGAGVIMKWQATINSNEYQ